MSWWPVQSGVRSMRATSTVVTPPSVEPLTLAQAKLRAGLDWLEGDPRDAQMLGFIRAARAKVEDDTGLALLTQTRDVTLDAVIGSVLTLPPQSRPLQSVTAITYMDRANGQQTFAPSEYVVDFAAGRIGLAFGAAWASDVRPFQPWTIRIVSGWETVEAIPPSLVHAVGLMTAHYATFGRDVLQVGHIVAPTPYGYEEAIAAYVRVTLA